jgi:hypothetical protein
MAVPLSRREIIRAKIMACVEIVDTGYIGPDGEPSPCHLWTAADSGNGRGGGYPRMWLDGQTIAAHKVNFTNEHGIIPGKKTLDHLCRQRLCVREDHLEMVTQQVNAIRREEANGRRRPQKRRKRKVGGK